MGNCCSKQKGNSIIDQNLNEEHVVVPPTRQSSQINNQKYTPIPINPTSPSSSKQIEVQNQQANRLEPSVPEPLNTPQQEPNIIKNCSTQIKKEEPTITGSNDHEDTAFGLLLAGAGESGKTTYNRQLRLKYLGGFEKEELRDYVNIIRGNLIEAMQILASWLSHHDLSVEDENQDALEYILELDAFEAEFDSNVVEHLHQLWEDPQIQKAFKNRDSTTIADHMDYFFSKIEEIAQPDYLPSDEDVLKARIRTIGISDVTFDFDGVLIRIYDVGGQKNERPKWAQVMSEVGGLLYCVSLADFDKPMFETKERLRIHDCLEIFHDLTHRSMFIDKPVFFLANKYDKFAEKIRDTDCFTAVFPDYSGNAHDPGACADFLFKLFLKEADPQLPDRPIFEYRLSALDSDQVCEVTRKISEYIDRTFYQ